MLRSFPGAYGITSAGAVLVRPDGVVGWRAKTADDASAQTLIRALASLLCRESLREVSPTYATTARVAALFRQLLQHWRVIAALASSALVLTVVLIGLRRLLGYRK